MAGKEQPLTSFHRRWCEFTVLGMRGIDALAELGWKGARPDVKVGQLNGLPKIKAYKAELEADAMATAEVTRTKIVKELARIAFADPRQLYREDGTLKEVTELADDIAATVASVEVEKLFAGKGEERRQAGVLLKVKQWPKVEALKELAAIAGLKKQDISLTGLNGGPVQIQIVRFADETETPAEPVIPPVDESQEP